MIHGKILSSYFLVFLSIVLQFILSTNGFASITRTRTMGDVGMIIRDDANYWLFPSVITLYGKGAHFELGGNSELLRYTPASYGFDQCAGGIIPFGKSDSGMLGAFWSETVSRNPFFTYTSSASSTDSKFDLFYGRQTDSGAFGIHAERHAVLYKSSQSASSESKTSSTRTRLDLGTSGSNYDASFGYQLATYSSSHSNYSANNTVYGHLINFRIRSFKQQREKIVVTPFMDLQFMFEKNNINDTDGLAWDIWTGAGLSYLISEGDLFVLGLSVLYSHQLLKLDQLEKTTIALDLPFVFGGIESELFPWLTIRFGFQKRIQRNTNINKYTSSKTNTIRTKAPFAATAGIGIKQKRLTIDLSFDSNFFQRGPYFLSGTKGDLFNLISIGYLL